MKTEPSPQADKKTVPVYEPPMLYVIGAVSKYTFGSGGNGIDFGGVHTRKSDARLKRSVTRIEDAIGKLRAI